jgi:hypothetical protein
MVEPALIEGAQVAVDPGVLDVTGDAVVRHVPVHALPLPDALRDRLVTREALGGGDTLTRRVTRQAAGNALERLVRATQAPG